MGEQEVACSPGNSLIEIYRKRDRDRRPRLLDDGTSIGEFREKMVKIYEYMQNIGESVPEYD